MAFVSCTKESKDEPYNPDGSLITQAQALEIVKEDIDQYDEVYVSKSIVKKGTIFKPYDHYGQVPCDSWVVIINTEPSANSGPYWLYIYVDPYSGNADKDSWEWGPPENVMTDYESVKYDFEKSADTKSTCSELLNVHANAMSTSAVSNNWAVIISGGVCPYFNKERYWNDCSAIYKCLRQVYGYRRDRILVLMSDGTSSGSDRFMIDKTYMSSPLDLDGDGTDDINYSATRSNLSKVFNYLKEQVKSDEQVFVFVTGHGSRRNGESYICLWNEEEISASEFAKEIGKITFDSRKHVVLGQCYSGGFVDPLLSSCSNISVATASEEDKLSNAMSGLKYDEFLYHWISAAAGRTPDGQTVDADKNGYVGVSAYEMFRYAEDNDTKDEKPQYSSKSESLGEEYGLSGEKFGYPVLSGPHHISSNPINGTFELTDLPAEYSVNWIHTDKISMTPLSPSSSAVRSLSDVAMDLDRVRAEITTPFKTYSLTWGIHLWRPGRNVTTDLISGSVQEGFVSLPYYVEGTDDYDWYFSCHGVDNIRSDTYFLDFTYTGEDNPEPYYISVRFNNPLGEETTIVRYYE